jgi:hypothetical protein
MSKELIAYEDDRPSDEDGCDSEGEARNAALEANIVRQN